MLTVEPYKFKNRSRESGQAWELIASNLNAIQASGVEVPELSELDVALEEIAEKEQAA